MSDFDKQLYEDEDDKRRSELHKQVVRNFDILEQWTDLKIDKVLYDSDKDGQDRDTFREKVIDHENVYFIVVDAKDNVFGHFHTTMINAVGKRIADDNMFMFTLSNNNRCGIKKFNRREPHHTWTSICTDGTIYECSYEVDKLDWYGVWTFDQNGGRVQDIQKIFEEVRKSDITGVDCSKKFKFTAKRLMVISMRGLNEDEIAMKSMLEAKEKLKGRGCNKFVLENVDKIEAWCEKRIRDVIYDSEIDKKISQRFRQRVMNHDKLCFIVVDENNNVFGHYHPSLIDRTDIIGNGIYDKNVFLFSLNSNGRCGVRKFTQKHHIRTRVYNDDKYYGCAYKVNGIDYYAVWSFEPNGGVIKRINNLFNDVEPTTLTGLDCTKEEGFNFTVKRLIVIQME